MTPRTSLLFPLLALAASACSQAAHIGDTPDASQAVFCDPELGTIRCAEGCVNPANDPNNCGRCGRVCAFYQRCSDSDCWPQGDAGWLPYPYRDTGWDPYAPDAGWNPYEPDGSVPSTIQPMKPGTLCTSGSPKWCSDTASPQRGDILSIWANGASDLRFLTENGTDLRYGPSGWSGTLLGAGQRRVLAGSGPSNQWAALATGGLEWFDGTKWSAVTGASGTFLGLYVTSAETWAVGETGKIVACSAGSCTAQTSPTTSKLNAVWGPAYSEIWAVGENGTIVSFDGNTWSTVTSPLGDSITAVWGWKSGQAFAMTNRGEVLTWSRGNPWKRDYGYTGEYQPAAVSPGPTEGKAWIARGARVYKVDDLNNPGPYVVFDARAPLYAVAAISDTEVWAGGANGYLVRWDGNTWSEIPDWLGPYVNPSYPSVHGTTSSDAWTVDETGSALHFNGSAWSAPQPTGIPWVKALWAVSATDVWAVGADGANARFDGKAWTRQPDVAFLTSKPDLAVLWGTSATDLWATGAGSFSAHWDGSKWTPTQQTGWSDMYAIGGSGPNDVWMVGQRTDAHRWTGSAWQTVTLPVGDFRALASLGTNQLFALTGSGELYKWNGSAWSKHCALASFIGRALWGVAGTTELWAGGAGGVRKVSTAAGQCELSNLPFLPPDAAVLSIWGTDPAHVFAGGSEQMLMHYAP